MQKTLFIEVLKEVAKFLGAFIDYVITGTIILLPIIIVKPEIITGLTYLHFISLTVLVRASIEVTATVVKEVLRDK